MNSWLCAVLMASALTGSELRAELRVSEMGLDYIRLEFLADDRDWEGGTFLVGVPPEGEVHLEVIEAIVADRDTTQISDGAEGVESGPAFLQGLSMARRQRVAELSFAPRIGSGGQREFFERVVVDLHFDAASAVERAVEDPLAETYYRQVLSNYAQARKWRVPSRALPAAKVAQGGERLRIAVREEGIYRVTGEDLRQAGVDLDAVDPQSLRLLYGGGRALTLRSLQPPRPLQEMGLVVEDGGDGRFDDDDFVLFYGESPERWEFDESNGNYVWVQNLYTRDNIYWLAFGGAQSGKRSEARSGALLAAGAQRPQSYRMRLHREDEQFILYQTFGIKSGYTWYGEDFRGNARNYRLVIRDAVAEPVDIRLGFIKIGGSEPSFTVKWNGETVGQISFEGSGYAQRAVQVASGPIEGLNELGLFHNSASEPTRLDWYELEYSRGFSAERGALAFASPVDEGVGEYRLSGFVEEQPRVFEVSQDLVEIHDFVYDVSNGEVVFQDDAGGLPGQYVVGGAETWKRPARLELDGDRALLASGRGADYIAIYHEDFRAAAERLARWRAEDRRFGEDIETAAVDVQDIYDEFSGGMLDPAAIRNFLAYAVRNWRPAPLYVVLMGDGSYDYKNNSATSKGNWIPPYQDGDSTYDEWYTRIIGDDVLPDLAIGRLPVQTAAVAERLVDKIIAYDREPEQGLWQSRMLLIADDLNNPSHPLVVEDYFLIDSESLANRYLPESLDLVKLYLAQFPLEGQAKPRARDEFIRRFNDGALIVTYLGHGNPDVLAHEQMFRVSRDLGEIDNGRRLPFFYTAASQVGVFDDPVKTSMPEELLNMEGGGVIGMISATRIGYHKSNVLLAKAFHGQMYRSGRAHVPVGLALMEAKQIARGWVEPAERIAQRNMQRYSLFGDPLQRLAEPRYKVAIDVEGPLSALGLVEVSGQVLDENGDPVDGYTGFVWLQAFDSAELSLLDNYRYRQVGAHIFRGRYKVENGRFNALFRVPKDITYGGEDGRISAYVWSESQPTAFGSLAGLVLAGTAQDVEIDIEGPQIRLGFVGQHDFRSGDAVALQPVLNVVLTDPSGINITGDTGHEIEVAIDDDVFKVTDFFSVLDGDYREGVVQFPLQGLEPGEHSIRLKAWDTFNNSSRAEADFVVGDGGSTVITDALFYPNPLRGQDGHFTYDLGEAVASVSIKVFSSAGRLVDEVEGGSQEGYNQIFWRIPADLSNGTYLYKIEVEREGGSSGAYTAALQITR